MSKTDKKYYAYVLSDRNISGIAETWAECERQVKGKNARFRGFKTMTEAQDWLSAGAQYDQKKKMPPGIYFDAGTGRGDGVEISVTDENGKNLLNEALPANHINKHGKHLIYGDATNNHGELLACKFAIQVALKKDIKHVYGDSALVVEYWSMGRIKKNDVREETVWLAEEVAQLRRQYEELGGEIKLISGDDNPADLGFHR